MSIRTININLEEQYPRPRTLGFFPDQTPREDDLLLDEVYIAKTNASGAGSIDLPTTSLGTIHYRVEIDGEDAGSFYLSSGGPVDLSDLLFAGGAATDSLIDYINNLLDDYAPLAGANFTGPIKAPSLQLLDPNYVPFLGGPPYFTLAHTADAMPVNNVVFDIVDMYFAPSLSSTVQVGRLTQMRPWGNRANGYVYGDWANIDNRGDNGVTNTHYAFYGSVNNEHTAKESYGGAFTAYSGGSGADNTGLLVGVQGSAGGAHNCTLQQAIGGDFWFSTSSSDPSNTALAQIVRAHSRHNPGHNTSDLRGLSIDSWLAQGGTVDKSYGIYIDASIDMGSTEKWTFYSLATSPSVFAGPVRVPGDPYSPTWDGSFEAPTKNDVYDALEGSFSQASPDYRRKIVHFTDCNYQTLGYDGGFLASATVAGMFGWNPIDWAGYPGALGLNIIHLRNAATNSCAILEVSPLTTANSEFAVLGRGVDKAKFRFGFVTLSDATNTYAVRCGLHNGGVTSAPTFGCHFRYTNSVNGGKWQAVCKNGAGETAQDTGIAATVGGLHTFEVVVNAAGTSAAFYIDGVLVNTITTNIPILTTEVVGASFQMLRSVGTADVDIMVIDYVRSEWNLTTPRP